MPLVDATDHDDDYHYCGIVLFFVVIIVFL